MKKNYKNSRYLLRKKGKGYLLSKLSNMFIKNGKKQGPVNGVANALRLLKVKKGFNPSFILLRALENITPVAELKSKIMGRVTYKIPFPIPKYRETKLGIKVLASHISGRGEGKLFLRLGGEILDSYEKKSNSYKFKLDLNKQIKQNRSLIRLVSLV